MQIGVGMGRRRGEVQILTEILSMALNGVKVTHLMYKANLSYSTLRKYLRMTVSQGLIDRVPDSDGAIVYCTTEKGKLLLGKLKEVKSALHS
jgi:predicted transcriptional regulator